MSETLKQAVTRATASVRSADPVAATRVIQRALGADAAGAATGRGHFSLDHVPEPALPNGARFQRGIHDGRHGRRSYRLYLPASPPGGTRRSMVVMLHGCTQTAENFATGTRMNMLAEAYGAYVLWPEQPQGANNLRCWNWFEPGHQSATDGEPAILAGMARAVAAGHGVDPGRIYVAGLSAGGAMAVLLGETHPDLFAAIGIHSGLPARAAKSLPDALTLMREGPSRGRHAARTPQRRIVFHGDADTTVHPNNGAALAAAIGNRTEATGSTRGRAWTRRTGPGGEFWLLHGAGHAWSGGNALGSHTDAAGPDASAEMLRFFLK